MALKYDIFLLCFSCAIPVNTGMTDEIKHQLLQKAYHYVRWHKQRGALFDITPPQIVTWIVTHKHVDDVLQRNGISGIQRVDEREPLSLSNIRFDAKMITGKTKLHQLPAEQITRPKNYKQLTMDQWIAELRENEANA